MSNLNESISNAIEIAKMSERSGIIAKRILEVLYDQMEKNPSAMGYTSCLLALSVSISEFIDSSKGSLLLADEDLKKDIIAAVSVGIGTIDYNLKESSKSFMKESEIFL